MKSPNPIIWPVLFLYITPSTKAKLHFTSHSTEIHALHHNKALHPNKRDFLTCEQTYGEGSIPCGGSDSKSCYDPTIGESCCMQDSGYCGLGDVCASIEGYCCHKDENEQICMLRVGISSPDDFTSDPDSSSDIDSEDPGSGLTSVSSSSSASQSQSESQSITHMKSDDESNDSDLGTESSDSDGASSPPISMLTNALNSGPLADEEAEADAEADADADTDEDADPDSVLDSGSDVDVYVDTGTNVNPEPTTVVLSLGTAVASAIPFDIINKDGVSSVRARESSTLVSSLSGVETSSAIAVSNANELTSSALPSQSISEGGLDASAITSGIDGTFTSGAMWIGRESGLEGEVIRSCLFLGVSFVVWVVL